MPAQPQLIVHDGAQVVQQDDSSGTLWRLAARIEGVVTELDAPEIGPALSALYGQMLAALLTNRTLGGLVVHVSEGSTPEVEPTGLEVDVARELYAGPVALFGFNCTVLVWQAIGQVLNVDAIMLALLALVEQNQPLDLDTIRERVLVAVQNHVAAALGGVVTRNEPRPVEAGEPAVILVDGDLLAQHDTCGLTRYEQRFGIEVFLPGGDTAGLDAQAQVILEALRSAGDLGGLAIVVELEASDPDTLRDEYSGPMVAARIDASVWFDTDDNDPTRLPI